MKKKSQIDPEELDLFHSLMEGVKPLTQKKVHLKDSPPIVRRKFQPEEPEKTEHFSFETFSQIEPVSGEEFISYNQCGISDKSLRKLRKGQYNIEAILDLHGMSIDEARAAVDQFLQQGLQDEIRTVLIIHGKGTHSQMPILKNQLNHWLRGINVVLAFCSAAPKHGGGGATYVLLKHVNRRQPLE